MINLILTALCGFIICVGLGSIYESFNIKKLHGWKYNWRIWIPFWYVEWKYNQPPDQRKDES